MSVSNLSNGPYDSYQPHLETMEGTLIGENCSIPLDMFVTEYIRDYLK